MMMMDEFCGDGCDDDTGCHSRGKAHGDKAEDKSVEVTKQDGGGGGRDAVERELGG